MKQVYYNENDPKAAAWLRELIKGGHIADGVVDERSILDVRADDLAGYTQCHFFAGIGGWSVALRLAGVPDDEEIWTGSCPCQPLSCAGLGKGHADERHLWPAFFNLIAVRKPAKVAGEQVASADGREWFAGVRADLEGVGYACGAADLCSAGVGSPNIRQRIYWLGISNGERRGEGSGQHGQIEGAGGGQSEPSKSGKFAGLADATGARLTGTGQKSGDCERENTDPRGRLGIDEPASSCVPRGMADPNGGKPRNGGLQPGGLDGQQSQDGRAGRMDKPDSVGGPSGVPGSDAGQEGNAGVADDAGDEPDQTRPDQTRPDQTRPFVVGARQAVATGRTRRA